MKTKNRFRFGQWRCHFARLFSAPVQFRQPQAFEFLA